jgi:hypothetical protein
LAEANCFCLAGLAEENVCVSHVCLWVNKNGY